MSSYTLTDSFILIVLMLIATDSLPRYVCSTCPPDMITVDSSICVVQVNASASLCDAGRQCAAYASKTGRQVFLVGRNFGRVVGKVRKASVYMWTSLNLLLSRVTKTKVGWRDGDPRDPIFQVNSEDALPWAPGQPNGGQVGGLVRFSTEFFRDAMQNYVAETICELVSTVSSEVNIAEYRVDYPFTLPVGLFSVSPNFDGCVDSVSTLTHFACALRCTERWECRSVYFYESENLCLLVLYFDARIPTKYATRNGRWQRYAKVKI